MKIVLARGTDEVNIVYELRNAILASRFTATDIFAETSRVIKIYNVRLRSSKPYCGNHPNACELGGRDRKHKYLEGADWVEFNDLLNDVLDNMLVCANVSSSVCEIRRGYQRRIRYNSYRRNFGIFQWEKNGQLQDFADYSGSDYDAPASKFPEGTPGIYAKIGYNVKG